MTNMTTEQSTAAVIIENDQTMSAADALRTNKALIATLNQEQAIEALKGVMAGPRGITGFPVHGANDLWELAVVNFRNRIATDNADLAAVEVNGRSILYNQLARAYEMGLMLVVGQKVTGEDDVEDTRRTYPELTNLLYWHGMSAEKEKVQKGTVPNMWSYVTKLLYGKWIKIADLDDKGKRQIARQLEVGEDKLMKFAENRNQKFEDKSMFHIWKPDRSAEKYANIFRYLQKNNVAPEGVANFIDSFTDKEHGNKLIGIEHKDRADNRKAPKEKKISDKAIERRQRLIARGERSDNGDVVECEKPTKLPDGVQYGRAMFKVVNGNMVLIYEACEQHDYENHVMAIGKKLIEEENQENEKQRQKEEAEKQAVYAVDGDFFRKLLNDHAAEVRTLTDGGVKPEQITAELIAVIKGMAVSAVLRPRRSTA